MLTIPGFFGLLLWIYHFYLAKQYEPEDEEIEYTRLTKYFEVIDTAMNYPFIIFLAIWATLYYISWKRTMNSYKYVWASESRSSEILKSQR